VPSHNRGDARPTSAVFLYGDVSANFATVSEPFVKASGGKESRIVLLMLPHSQQYEARYRKAWRSAGAGEVVSILPSDHLSLERDQVRSLKRSTGLFMSGGDTALYQRIYGTKSVARLIRELHASGVPYGGVSAGAMMACETLVVRGSMTRTRRNQFHLVADSSRAASRSGRSGITVRTGLGLVKNCVLEPHFAEWGHFPRIIEAMKVTRSRYAVGVDASICLEIQDGRRAIVRGQGRAYFFCRGPAKSGSPTFETRVYDPGSQFEFGSR